MSWGKQVPPQPPPVPTPPNHRTNNFMPAASTTTILSSRSVVIGGDMIARLPPRSVGGAHGVVPRLLLDVRNERAPLHYSDSELYDELAWTLSADDKAHGKAR